jgi:hypothetical protein
MKKRVPAALGSKAKRNGLRSPQAKVSWHFFPGSVRPVRLHRALSVPWYGFPAGIPPSRVMRSTFPVSTCWSRAASFDPAQPPPA